MTNQIKIINSIFQSFSSESKGGSISIDNPSNVFLINLKFIKSHSNDCGGGCYLDCFSFFIKCCSFVESISLYASALFAKANDKSLITLSSISSSRIQSTTNTHGAPTLIHLTSFIFTYLNYSYNIVNHVCGLTSYKCKESYVKYVRSHSQSLQLSVLCQTESNQELFTYLYNNYINNDVKTRELGLIRTFECKTCLIFCYFKDNIAKFLFEITDGTIDVINCCIEQNILSETISFIKLTIFEENHVNSPYNCGYCSHCKNNLLQVNKLCVAISKSTFIFIISAFS